MNVMRPSGFESGLCFAGEPEDTILPQDIVFSTRPSTRSVLFPHSTETRSRQKPKVGRRLSVDLGPARHDTRRGLQLWVSYTGRAGGMGKINVMR